MSASPPGERQPLPAELSVDDLRELAGVDTATVERLVGAGVLVRRDAERPFVAGDVYRIRLVLACEAAGMAAEAIGTAIDAGRLSLGFMDLPHYRWAGLSSMTYRDVAEQMELSIEVVLDVAQSMGSIGRTPNDRVRQDELDVFPLIRFAGTVLDADALMRTARVYGQALERITDAEGALWEQYILGGLLRQGMSLRDAADVANAFGAEAAPMQERMLLTAYRRQQERKWNEYTIEDIESVLDEMGLYRRTERPNAFAFLDLAGYTALTEQRGDAESARIAADLGRMVDAVATEWRGRPISGSAMG
jgi:adenylate cyclase